MKWVLKRINRLCFYLNGLTSSIPLKLVISSKLKLPYISEFGGGLIIELVAILFCEVIIELIAFVCVCVCDIFAVLVVAGGSDWIAPLARVDL